jgi:hypothetical protein
MEETQRPTPDDILLPPERTFSLGDTEVVIRALPLMELRRIVARFADAGAKIAQDHPELDLSRPQEWVPTLLVTYADLGLDLVAMLLKGQVERSRIEQEMTLPLAAQIIVAALEVNQLPLLGQLLARGKQLMKSLSQSGLRTMAGPGSEPSTS